MSGGGEDRPTPAISASEIQLIGLAVYMAQTVEFALYGIAAHAAHIESAKKDGRFRDLDPERFLRGDPEELKATLGAIVQAFGDAFLIKTAELERWVGERNLIVHDYFRTFVSPPRGVARRTDGEAFLLNFVDRALRYEQVAKGLLYHLMEAAADKDDVPFTRTPEMATAMSAYESHATQHLSERLSGL